MYGVDMFKEKTELHDLYWKHMSSSLSIDSVKGIDTQSQGLNISGSNASGSYQTDLSN